MLRIPPGANNLPLCAFPSPAVPEPAAATLSPGPPRHHLHPSGPALPLATSSSSSSSCASPGNGKRAPAAGQIQSPAPPQQQQQCQPSSASPRYPPREVPPRFRHQELKQLLKRGQPLPAGSLGGHALPNSNSASSSTSGDVPNAAKRLPGEGST